MSDNPTFANIQISLQSQSLANGSDIESQWIDTTIYQKYSINYLSSSTGLTLTITSNPQNPDDPDSTYPDLANNTTFSSSVFYQGTFPCRQRYMKFKITNNTGVAVTDVNLEVRFLAGAGAGENVSPLASTVLDSSVAALNKSVITGSDGSSYNNAEINEANALATYDKGAESVGNSSTTPLSSGATFTGTGEQNGYSHVGVMLKTDNTGTLYFDFSNDGTNWDSTFPVNGFGVASGISEFHTAVKLGRYFRVRLVNDTGAQTYLRLATYYGNHFVPSVAPLNQTAGLDQDAIFTRGTVPSDEVALGRRGGAETWNKFGYNEDVDTASAEVIAAFGGAFDQRLAAAETLDIVSDNAADATGGTGLRTAVMFGVDGDWNQVTEVLALSGTTTVTTTNTYQGVNRITIFQSGSADSNVGTITATATTSGNVMATIPAGEGTTQQCIFYVPDNYQLLTTWLYLNVIKSSGGGSPSVTFKGFVYSDVVDSVFEVYRDSVDLSGGGNNVIQLQPAEPFVIGERSILWFEASTTSNNTSVRGRFSGKLYQSV